MKEPDKHALEAKDDPDALADLIKQNEFLIIKTCASVTHRFITKNDDEFSIALLAFHEAVKTYELEKGRFLSFASLVIKRRLIDYVRKQDKHKLELSVNPSVFDTEPEEDDDENISIRLAVSAKVSQRENKSLTYEIEEANQHFSQFGFSFYDLTSCSPKSKKTKEACSKAVGYLLSNPVLIDELNESKLLAIKIIEKNTKLPRKLLERHRKYIIAAVMILSGEYPNLADYLRCIRKEMDK